MCGLEKVRAMDTILRHDQPQQQGRWYSWPNKEDMNSFPCHELWGAFRRCISPMITHFRGGTSGYSGQEEVWGYGE